MSMQSIEWKLAHAGIHLARLEQAVLEYLDSRPIGLVEMPDSKPDATHHRVQPIKKVPARIGLICGDCLQNLRSTLDYLVTELVKANGGTPNTKHMFPIATQEAQWDREIRSNNRLKGVDPKAQFVIETLQPFLRAKPQVSELYMIDELTNLNKHRRPIIAGVQGTKRNLKYDFPHITGIVQAAETPGGPITSQVVHLWVGFGEDIVLNMEVFTTVKIAFTYIENDVVPLFRKFLE